MSDEEINLGNEDETIKFKPLGDASSEVETEEFNAEDITAHLLNSLISHKDNILVLINQLADPTSFKNEERTVMLDTLLSTFETVNKTLSDYIQSKNLDDLIVKALQHELKNIETPLLVKLQLIDKIASKYLTGEIEPTRLGMLTRNQEECISIAKKFEYYFNKLDSRLTQRANCPVDKLVLNALANVNPLLLSPLELNGDNLFEFSHFTVADTISLQLAITEIFRNASKADATKIRIYAITDSSIEAGASMQIKIYNNGSKMGVDTAYLNSQSPSTNKGVDLIRDMGFSYTLKNNDKGEGVISTLQFPVKFRTGKPYQEA